ncbi:methyltransferase family protein [Anaeropeptidivorans aminofermentans]|uniref:methyltransferase family protein n=1 Tax=Anaeropeptidivorans aminofermentans TaxID=2934315 RepID=UPI002024C186|nr:isoprenylcysteine carboxylmethyltransferase family protein [Anaeropeptidivorans aminofermentans]
MKRKLLIQSCTQFLMGLSTVSLLLFLPAGSIDYWNAWIFIGLLFIPMLITGIILLLKAPDLLAKRLNTKEKEIEQKQVITLSVFMFAGGFIVAALDFKYSWSNLPDWVIIAAAVIFLTSYGLYAEIMRENAYLSRTVEVQESQKVIDTGLYGIVRHPMYFVTITLFLSMPLILGSVYSFIIFLIYPILIIKRIKNEEAVLREKLNGYIEYSKKVKYRLIPYIW